MDSRVFSTAFVKACCEEYYRKPLYPTTWVKWKSWAEIDKNSRVVTYEQFLILFAITYLRKKEPTKVLDGRDVASLINNQDFITSLEAAIEYINYKDFYLGSELPKVLKKEYGISVSIKSLIESIPGFGLNKTYDLKKVLKSLDKQIIK